MNNIILFLLLIMTIFSNSYAAYSVGGGGYVPFGSATQKDKDGEDNKTTLHPMIILNVSDQLEGSHLAYGDIGYVYHRSTDNYSKKTMFFLFDIGYMLVDSFIIRYGIGSFWTRISGDGGPVTVRNGSGYATAYMPKDPITSYNTSINLGMEFVPNSKYSLNFETYTFGILSSEKRHISYALSFRYFL